MDPKDFMEPEEYMKYFMKRYPGSNSFAEAYLTIIDKLIGEGRIDKDFDTCTSFPQKYEEYFSEFSPEELSNVRKYLKTKGQKIVTKETLKKYFKDWVPPDGQEDLTRGPSNKQRYLIIQIGFVLKLSAEETNTLLKADGLSELSGRIFDQAIEIYCLNNKKTYIECEKQKELHENKLMLKRDSIETIADLRRYVDRSQEKIDNNDRITVVKLTIVMTKEAQGIKTEVALDDFINENIQRFVPCRETARRYLCKYLLAAFDSQNNQYTDYENKLKKSSDEREKTKIQDSIEELRLNGFARNYPINDKSNISFEKIWNMFEAYYDYYTITKANKYVERSTRYLRPFLSGEREITRKFYILFLIFLGEKNPIRLDHCLVNAGFESIGEKNFTSEFDDLIHSMLIQRENMDSWIEQVLKIFKEKYDYSPFDLDRRGDI